MMVASPPSSRRHHPPPTRIHPYTHTHTWSRDSGWRQNVERRLQGNPKGWRTAAPCPIISHPGAPYYSVSSMWRRNEIALAPARRSPPAGPSPTPPGEQGGEEATAAEEEVLLALRMMCQSGLRHPLHGHSYSRYTALRPRVCHSCEAPVFGPFSKACHCLSCGIIVHRQCVMRITRVPCGSYRGLRDPDGRHSASTVAVTTKAPPPEQAQDDDGEVMWRRTQDGGGSNEEEEEADALLSSSPSGGARRMTYEALARVGALVGSIVGGGSGEVASTASSTSSIFNFSALKGAGALAGAYTGYRQQGGERLRHSYSVDAATPPSPVAMAWSHLAQRLSRPDERGAFMDLATFVRHLEQDLKGGGETGASISSPGLGGSVNPLIGQLLRSPATPPGYVWAACLDHFVRRHAVSADSAQRAPSPPVPSMTAAPDTASQEGVDEPGAMPAGSCCEDAAAIIHEVALVLMEYVPGLLGSSMEAYEEAFEAVETEIMTTLYPSVLHECQERARALSRAVEAWYLQPPEAEEEGGSSPHEGTHYDKAVQELVGMSLEVTGRKKVQRVLRACLALGEGNVVMTADELLPAMGRVVRLARVPYLPAHLAFIEETCDTGALLGAEGYALTSLQVGRSSTLAAAERPHEECAHDCFTLPLRPYNTRRWWSVLLPVPRTSRPTATRRGRRTMEERRGRAALDVVAGMFLCLLVLSV